MKRNKELISIVLPTLNEKESIGLIINHLLDLSNIHELEIIVVDDNSKDGTSDLIRKLSKKDNRIRLISRIGRNGLSSAIKEGCISSTGEIIVIMDTDGQHDVNDITKALNALQKEDKDV